MQYTDNLKLDLVEGTDNANLMDFYNHSMRLIDQAYTRLTVDYETIVKQSGDTSNLVSRSRRPSRRSEPPWTRSRPRSRP